MKNSARNKEHMKFYNRQVILNIINKKPISRAELARQTGLTRAAITIIVDELIQEGIIMETTTADAGLGRKPILLDTNKDSFYAVGLNIYRGGCTAGITDFKGNVKSKIKIELPETNADEALKAIKKEMNRLIEESGIEKAKLLGIGISTPGPIDAYKGKILNPPNFKMWHGIEIVNELKNAFPYKIFLENNSISLALAERNFGEGRRFNSFMLLVVDTGIGAGIIINDRLYRGVGGFGGEVGHTSIDINGRPCDCGNKGCLEVYASIPSIINDTRMLLPEIETWNDIVDRALRGDKECTGVIENEARLIASGIVNTVNILELEAVILAGLINYRPEMLLERVRETVHSTAITRDMHKVQICRSSITRDSDITASAAVVIDKFFNEGI